LDPKHLLPAASVAQAAGGKWVFCLQRCRTNAAALAHMNAYKSTRHFCYAAGPPPVAPVSANRGESCTAACARQGMVCEASRFASVNTCAALRKHFRCVACDVGGGFDQPAWVALDAPQGSLPGHCLYNADTSFFSCDGKHAQTVRLCPCM